MNDTSPIRKPRFWRPQFSLRMLLIALSLFGIGFPIWYRWPYQEVLEQRDPITGAVTSKRFMNRQRQWGGESLPHGKQEDHFLWAGRETVITTHYVRGKRQGPYSVREGSGEFKVKGEHSDDMREGVWTYTDGRYKAVANYHHDKIDGTLKIEAVPETRQPAILAVFDAGRLTEFNGRPITDHLFEVRESRPLDERTWNELRKETQIDFVEVPLKDAIDFLKDSHNLPIGLDVKHVPDIDLPLTACYSHIDLAVALSLLTAPHDLACDYRYGCLWITSAEDAKDWHDPTGVANLKPPKGSALEGCWDERVPRLDIVNTSLADVLNAFQRELTTGDIELRATSSGGVSPSVTIQSPEGLPFRHVLGQMLYFTGCRCKLEGDKLVILPPEEKP